MKFVKHIDFVCGVCWKIEVASNFETELLASSAEQNIILSVVIINGNYFDLVIYRLEGKAVFLWKEERVEVSKKGTAR